MLAAFAAFAAFAALAMASGVLSSDVKIDSHWLLGVSMTLGAAVLYVLITLLTKRIRGQRAEVTVFWQAFTGIVMLSPFVIHSPLPQISAQGWLLGLGMGPYRLLLRADIMVCGDRVIVA